MNGVRFIVPLSGVRLIRAVMFLVIINFRTLSPQFTSDSSVSTAAINDQEGPSRLRNQSIE